MTLTNLTDKVKHVFLKYRTRPPSEHAVKKWAIQDGLRAVPASDDARPSAAQQKIIQSGNDAIAGWRQHVHDTLEDCDRATKARKASFSDLDLLGPIEDARHQLENEHTTGTDERRSLRAMCQAAEAELDAFKRQNDLTREADYPISQVLAIGLLMLLMTVEVAFSAQQLGEFHTMGRLGGIMAALLVGFLNISSSFFFGIVGFRQKNHVDATRRQLAWLATLSWLGLILGFNLYIGHYRIAQTIDAENAAVLAGSLLWENPLGIGGAVQLFGIGMLSAIVAMWDGYTLYDDRYPRFGAQDRKYRRAIQAVEWAKRRSVMNIKGAVQRAHRTIERRLDVLNDRTSKVLRLLNHAIACLTYGEERVAQSCRNHNTLLRFYREENEAKRAVDSPIPPSCIEWFDFDEDLGCDATALVAKKAEIKKLVEVKQRAAIEALERLRTQADRDIAAIGRGDLSHEGQPRIDAVLTAAE